jgi:hypothetical protein
MKLLKQFSKINNQLIIERKNLEKKEQLPRTMIKYLYMQNIDFSTAKKRAMRGITFSMRTMQMKSEENIITALNTSRPK